MITEIQTRKICRPCGIDVTGLRQCPDCKLRDFSYIQCVIEKEEFPRARIVSVRDPRQLNLFSKTD